MTQRESLIYWGLTALAVLTFLWFFGGILGPFLFGAAIAYVADPLARKLEDIGLSRGGATLLINAVAFLLVLIAVLLLVPLLYDQTQRLLTNAPGYIDDVAHWMHGSFPDLFPDPDSRPVDEDGKPNGLSDTAKRWSLSALKGVVSGGLAFFDFLGVLVIAPIVAFYLLLDWDRLIESIDKMLPRKHADTIRGLAQDIDGVLSGFLRGQLSVCLILGSFYAVALMIVGLEFGLLVGIFAGIISFIPFVGSIVGLFLSVGLAVGQFWGEWWIIGLVAGIFIVGQLVEGNILTPMLVGGQVGLHPVWLIFALSAFGSAFGFAGLLVAVPLAAAIGVLARWALTRYRDSELYTGKPEA